MTRAGDVETAITDERKLHKELDAEIREWEKKLKKTHKNMGGVHMSAAHTQKVSKDVRKLENQLQLVRHERRSS
jgi:hypothetical protein